MLRSWVGENRHAMVTTEKFRQHAERFAAESLSELFTDWLDRPALPPVPAAPFPPAGR